MTTTRCPYGSTDCGTTVPAPMGGYRLNLCPGCDVDAHDRSPADTSPLLPAEPAELGPCAGCGQWDRIPVGTLCVSCANRGDVEAVMAEARAERTPAERRRRLDRWDAWKDRA